MDEQESRERVDRLRLALGGATDEATRGLERRIGAGDLATARRVDALRLTRDVVAADAEAEPSPQVMARLIDMARAREVLPPRDEWLIAVPVAMPAGVRGRVQQEDVLHLHTEEFLLTVTLALTPIASGRAVHGQLVTEGGNSLPDIDLALIVDRKIITTTRSDAFGEFAFAAVEGGEYMLRLEGSYGPHFIQLRRDDAAA